MVISDIKKSVITGGVPGQFSADVRSYTNEYPYGMEQPGRWWDSSLTYRWGYNWMECDAEVSGTGDHYTSYFRQYDPRVARWWSNDPVTFPGESPYVAMAGNPIALSDASGAEPGGGGDDKSGGTTGGSSAYEGSTGTTGDGSSSGNGGIINPFSLSGPLGGGALDAYTAIHATNIMRTENFTIQSGGQKGQTLHIPLGPKEITGFTLNGISYSARLERNGKGLWQFAGFYTASGKKYAPLSYPSNIATIAPKTTHWTEALRDGLSAANDYLPGPGTAAYMVFDLIDAGHILVTARTSSMPSHLWGEIVNSRDETTAGIKWLGVLDGGLTSIEGASIQSMTPLNKVPWTSWNDYPKVLATNSSTGLTEEYAEIGGRLYSSHAVERMQPSYMRYSTYGGGDGSMPQIMGRPNPWPLQEGQSPYEYGRGVPPVFVEQVIRNGNQVLQETLNYSTTLGSLQIITTQKGVVITVIIH
jgi:RHS repeat-associated protein